MFKRVFIIQFLEFYAHICYLKPRVPLPAHAGIFGKLYLLGEKEGTLRGVVPVPERTARPGVGQASQMSREAELGSVRI